MSRIRLVIRLLSVVLCVVAFMFGPMLRLTSVFITDSARLAQTLPSEEDDRTEETRSDVEDAKSPSHTRSRTLRSAHTVTRVRADEGRVHFQPTSTHTSSPTCDDNGCGSPLRC